MSTNKHAQIRYRTLDNCFRNPGRRYYIEDLVCACNDALYNIVGVTDGVKLRQVQDDIKSMENIWDIPLEKIRDGKRVFYRYTNLKFSINNQPLNETELKQLKETIFMLNRFKGMPQFCWMEEILARFENEFNLRDSAKNIVDFENNPYLKGLNYFSDIFNAIINKQTINITYKRYQKEETQLVFHPYFLKQYNNRWFLFGLCDHLKEAKLPTNLALDRIETITHSNTKYIENKNFEFNDYFDDVVGVTVLDKNVEKVILEIDNLIFPYIETKPLHGSQKVLFKNDVNTTIELKLIINFELENLLLSYIDNINIIEPLTLKNKMVSRLKEALQKNS